MTGLETPCSGMERHGKIGQPSAVAVVDRLNPFWLHRVREMAPFIGNRGAPNLVHHPG
jgi:hypothetical protein